MDFAAFKLNWHEGRVRRPFIRNRTRLLGMGSLDYRRRTATADCGKPAVTLAEFERQVYAVAAASPICGVPLLRRLTPTSVNLRLDIVTDDFIDVFFNEQTDTLAYAVIR